MECSLDTGIKKRLRSLHNRGAGGSLVFCPIDDSLLAGPFEGLRDMKSLVSSISAASPSAILAFRGTLQRFSEEIGDTPTILNCTASIVGEHHVEKVIVHSVEEAISLGADAVAGHINLFSETANDQIATLGSITRVAHSYGMPVVAIAYPRKSAAGVDDNFEMLKREENTKYAELVAHAVRVSVELGADIIKTNFTGERESFPLVLDAACGVPLVIAGGPKVSQEEALSLAKHAIGSGAMGVSFGRNVFNRANPGEFVARLKAEV